MGSTCLYALLWDGYGCREVCIGKRASAALVCTYAFLGICNFLAYIGFRKLSFDFRVFDCM